MLASCAVGKSKKKEQREAERAQRAQAQALQQRLNFRRRVIVTAIPVLTAAAAATSWFVLENKPATGAVILGGAMIWLLAGLGFIASAVPPRDRIKAGSIDFGRKRK